METDSETVLDIAVRRGLLSQDQADACRSVISGVADPVSWLAARKFLSPGQEHRLRESLAQLNRDHETSKTYVQEGRLSAEAAEDLRVHQIQSISSENIPTLIESARDLNILMEPGSDVDPEDQTKLLSLNGRSENLILDRYEIHEEIGSGGGGSVFRGVDRQLERIVAIKKVSQDGHRRFLREAQATARLEHPHIVPIFDMGERDDACYLILQFIEGCNLGLWIEKHNPSASEIAGILRQVAEGIDHAHRNSILHRDVKPENILIDNKSAAWVTDFGLARETDSDSRVTISGSVLGTPVYMSPEQARGDLDLVDPRSDVYSIGATLYCALTREPPFSGRGVQEVLRKVISHDPARPRSIDPDIPTDLETICLKAMEKDPQRRYESALALAEDLNRFQQGESILARPPSVIYQFRKWVWKRKPFLIAVSTAVVLALIGGGGYALLSEDRAFQSAKNDAQLAYEDKDWERSLAHAERALEIRSDSGLSEIARESRRKIAKKEAFDRLRSKIRPLIEMIADARSLFYIEKIDLVAKLDPIRKELFRWEKIMADPLHADFAEGWRALGLGWSLVGTWDQAGKNLLTALKFHPRDSWINYSLARICLYRGIAERWKPGAKKSSPEAERLMKKAVSYLNVIRDGWGPDREMELLIAEAYRAIAEEKTDEVIHLCRKGLDRFGEDRGTEEFWVLLAWTRKGAETIAAYDRALARKPHDPWILFLRANGRAQKGDFPGAISDLTGLIGLRPDFQEALHFRGVLRAMGGDYTGAIEDLKKVPEFDPPLAEIYDYRAESRYRKGDWRGAIEDFTEVILLRPEDPGAYFDRALTYTEAKDFLNARADVKKALELSTPSWNSRKNAESLLKDLEMNLKRD